MSSNLRSVVLLSGGVDSATTLAIAQQQGFDIYALTVRYGQRHAMELDAARAVAARMGVARHVTLEVDLRSFGGSALTDDINVPLGRSTAEIGAGVPVTYVPARNTIFLSVALAWAEVIGAEDIFIGVNALDYSGYPDCRPEFIAAFERLARVGTRAGAEEGRSIRIHAPLIEMTKAQIIRKGLELGVDLALTRSCYDPVSTGEACGRCDACLLRLRGFAEAGIADPVRYVEEATP